MEEEVERVAFNARLKIEEREGIIGDFGDILDWFSEIEEEETEGVEPAFHPIDLEDELRGDEVEGTLDREEALENTEHEEDGFFKGPKIG